MSVAPKPAPDLYEIDFAEWSTRQAALLRTRRFGEIDLDNIAEEIESLGRGQRNALESQIKRLLLHLLKWRIQPERRGTIWEISIVDARQQIAKTLRESPSLKRAVPESLVEEYLSARRLAAIEMGVAESALPAECPFTVEQVLDPDFMPD